MSHPGGGGDHAPAPGGSTGRSVGPSTMLAISGLSKTFPGTRALSEVSLSVAQGEVRALVGANGSGKSTLIKVLAGFHEPDPGAEIAVAGLPVAEAGHLLRFVHQDLGLVQQLGVADNLALRGGYTRGRFGQISWRRQLALTRQVLDRFGLDIDLDAPLSRTTPVQRTMIAIAGALQGWEHEGDGLLVLDEPTAVLPQSQVETLLSLVRSLRERGASILYVSHRLDELYGLADTVTVLRGGREVATCALDTVTTRDLGRLMVGQEVSASYRADVAVPDPGRAEPVLEVRGAVGRDLAGVDLVVRRGEVVGLAGLPGSGHEELVGAISGAVPTVTAGTVAVAGGRPTSLARQQTGALPSVPADRLRHGIVGGFSVRENVSLSTLDEVARGGVLQGRRERRRSARWLRELAVKTAGDEAPIASLSGGNQQKVVIGRSLRRRSPVLVLSEPTAGVDIGSRVAIYDLIASEAMDGLGVVMTSTDLADLHAVCTRIVVFRDGVPCRTLPCPQSTDEDILNAMEDPDDADQLQS